MRVVEVCQDNNYQLFFQILLMETCTKGLCL